MAIPTFTRLTDMITEVFAVHFNQFADALDKIKYGAMLADYADAETISATWQLADDDAPVLAVTASGADRTVELAPEASTNHPVTIINAGSSYNVVVKDDSGAVTYITLAPGEMASLISTGSAWVLMGNFWKHDQGYISGLKLTWVSNTAIDIETGAAYIPSLGRIVQVSSKISKTGLSLSASTWYHVYLYESSGAAAVEVVTTAPAAAYFGTARAKTGDTSRRYLGSILADGSSNVYKFAHDWQRGLVHWLDTNQAASPFRALSAGTAATATAIAMSGCAPATAIAAVIQGYSNGDKTLRIGTSSSLASTVFSIFMTSGSAADKFVTAEIPIDASGNIYYRFDSAVGSGGATIDCFGYVFER